MFIIKLQVFSFAEAYFLLRALLLSEGVKL